MKKQDCEQLTLFPVDSPANRSPALGNEKEQGMTVTSGQKCLELLRNFSPLGLLAKMLLVSSVWQSQMVNLGWKTERLIVSRVKTTIKEYTHSANACCSAVSYKTSLTSATPSSHLLFRLAVSKLRTSGSGYLLLPTPVAADAEQGAVIGKNDIFRETENGTLRKVNQNGTDGSIGLGRMAQLLPTPTASVGSHGGPCQRDSSGRPGLQMAAQLWLGTPTAGTSTSERNAEYKKGLTPNPQEFAQMFPTPRAKECGDYQYSNGDHEKRTLTLSSAVKLFPTPKATIRGDCPSERARKSPDLASVVKIFPTPTTGAGMCGGTGNFQQLQRLKDSGAITEDERRNMSQGNGGQLNPTWVEWLMGFPLGWTDIDLPCETPEKVVGWWDIEPDVPRVAVGVKNRVDRLKCLGNAVVPYQVYPILQAIFDIENQQK